MKTPEHAKFSPYVCGKTKNCSYLGGQAARAGLPEAVLSYTLAWKAQGSVIHTHTHTHTDRQTEREIERQTDTHIIKYTCSRVYACAARKGFCNIYLSIYTYTHTPTHTHTHPHPQRRSHTHTITQTEDARTLNPEL